MPKCEPALPIALCREHWAVKAPDLGRGRLHFAVLLAPQAFEAAARDAAIMRCVLRIAVAEEVLHGAQVGALVR